MPPLIESLDETKLRSLKFSEFTGREPFVLNNLNTKLETRVGIGLQVTKRAEDLVRIAKLLKSPTGLRFIANTSLLAFSENIKKSEKLSLQTAGIQAAKTVASTLATILLQVPVSGTGTRFSADELAGTTYFRRENSIDVRLKMGGARGTASSNPDKKNYLKVEDTDIDTVDEDIIPFKINIVSAGKSYFLYFRAYLEDLSDNFRGEWNSTKYIGRAEPFYNYNGFDRNIGFSFKIAATSRAELIPLYQKLNYLVGSTAPTYIGPLAGINESENLAEQGIQGPLMSGNYIVLTIGDYLVDVPGFFESVDVSWDKSYPWEIKRGRPKEELITNDESIKILPHILDVRISFKPIHNFAPALRKPFIGNINILDPDKEELDNRFETPLQVPIPNITGSRLSTDLRIGSGLALRNIATAPLKLNTSNLPSIKPLTSSKLVIQRSPRFA